MSFRPLVLARGTAFADERQHHALGLVARLRQLAPAGDLAFTLAFVHRGRRPFGHAVACRAVGGELLGYAFGPQAAEDLLCDLQLAQAGPQRRAA